MESAQDMTQPLREEDVARVNAGPCTFRADDVKQSAEFRAEYAERSRLITPEMMPMEECDDGLIKHLMHERFGSAEMCVEAYMQFLAPNGASGKHRHMWEEIVFVLEGEGYDLHWDMSYHCEDEYHWKWAETPKRFDWKRGDFIFIPPFTIHQHWNASATSEARVIVISNRIVKKMGFDWLDQVEPAPKP
ncbi:MAG: cupin 2 [Rhodospirillales bacterium]|jgi:uncharacterized RmlC-like cupin family protein|nr:cupin 2 [Rhodospirillales bacterium]